MLFSLSWLRELCPGPGDVADVAARLTARGLTVDRYERAGDDYVLDVDVPANRPDCLGHRGLSRELAAASGGSLADPVAPPPPAGQPAAARIEVEIDEPALCRRYTATWVQGVRVGPSPRPIAARLERCGMRSVNNVVDASNLVLLELGHPIHFFDAARLRRSPGAPVPRIRVRRARAGERLTTLDGVERVLDPEMLVIADAERAIGLAGAIGGADTEISSGTHDVVIEAADFCPRTVRACARRLELRTEASYRFERGVDPLAPPAAQALAAHWLTELASGTPAPGLVDVWPRAPSATRLRLRPAQLGRLLGFDPPLAEVERSFVALGLTPSREADGRIAVTVPSWRQDLAREADLVEEVARHLGYDRIPAVAPAPDRAAAGADPELDARARSLLAHVGFHEALGYSMIAADEDGPFVRPDCRSSVALRNPIAEPLAVLRRSVLPGLLRACDLNFRRGVRDVRLFEVGHVFHATAPGERPLEPHHLGLAWSGAAGPRHWSGGSRAVDLYDLIGIVERLLAGLRPSARVERAPARLAALHPARSLAWCSAHGPLAWAGELHPRQQERLDHPVFVAEVDLEAVGRLASTWPRHTALARLPAVFRDLALVLGPEHTWAEIRQVLGEVAAPAPASFEVIDRYVGPPLEPRASVLTVRVRLQPNERTLTDPETEAYRESLIEAVRTRLAVVIRGSADPA